VREFECGKSRSGFLKDVECWSGVDGGGDVGLVEWILGGWLCGCLV